MAHQVGEEGHVVGHLHTSGHSDGLTGEKAVSPYRGQEEAQPQKPGPFHFLRTPDFTTWLGLNLKLLASSEDSHSEIKTSKRLMPLF